MIIMMINYVDNNFDNANDDNGDQTITMFLTMHFREPLISEKPRFLAVTLGWVYNYGCCQVTTFLFNNASVMFLWRSRHFKMSGYNIISL